MNVTEDHGSAGRPLNGYTRTPREVWTYFAAALFAAFYLVTSVEIAARRPLWFDEIVTVIISRLSGLSGILEALAHVDNNMPVLYFLVVHWFDRLMPGSDLAARLPSALALIAGMLIAFDCARRLSDGAHGLIAMSVLGCSVLPYYGYEARSYGIYFMLSALGLWVWLHVKGRWWPAVLFGAVLFLNIMFHYYAVLCLVPYAAWELFRWNKWRVPSARLIAGALAIGCAAAVLFPQMSGAKRYSAAFWSPPSLFKLRTTFPELFPDAMVILAVILIWIALTARFGRNTLAPPMEAGETIGWLGFLIPFAGYVIARVVTNAYVDRYFISLLPGVAVSFAVMVWRHFRESRLVSMGILTIMVAFGVVTQLRTLRHPQSIDPFGQQTATRQAMQLEPALRNDGKRHILLTNGLLFLELNYYAKDPNEYVLWMPSPQYLEVSNTARYTFGLGRYRPMQFWNLEELRKHLGETALLQPGLAGLKIMKDVNIVTTARFTDPMEVDYLR